MTLHKYFFDTQKDVESENCGLLRMDPTGPYGGRLSRLHTPFGPGWKKTVANDRVYMNALCGSESLNKREY
jgi:hypothetical protein